jgi:hypothetical protein
MIWHDRTGKRYGRLTALGIAGRKTVSGKTRIIWRCACDCGNEIEIVGIALGGISSCGCLRIEAITVHGRSGTPEHRAWMDLHQRCCNPRNPRYQDYGGRGISVCQRWNDFGCFFEDVGERPSAEYSIDRYPNNDGNYEPGNVRWATRSQQQNNTRRSRRAA